MELEELEKKQLTLWNLIKQGNTKQEAKELFEILENEFKTLVQSSDDSKYRYKFMRFYFVYLMKSKDFSFNTCTSLLNHWESTYTNDDFPLNLLTELLKIVNDCSDHHINAVTRIANNLFDNEEYATAKMYYEGIENKLTYDSAWYNWANCYFMQEDHDTALEILTKGILQDPDSILLACNRGFCLMRLTRYDEAVVQLSKAIEYAEKNKYCNDYFYNYAVDLKICIYSDCNRPLYVLMEKSQLLSSYSCDKNEIVDSVKELLL